MGRGAHNTVLDTTNIMVLNLNTLRPRQNGRHFPDAIFQCIFLNENVWILLKISLKFVPKGPINNIPALVQIMAWRRPGDKPLSEAMLVRLLTHKCVTRPQWVNVWGLIIPPLNEVEGGYTVFTLSICPSVDRILSGLYLLQYSLDPFNIYTSYQATSEGVSPVKFFFVFFFQN